VKEEGVQVHYINLEKRKDRNDSFMRVNAALAAFHRVDAVEGARLQVDDLLREGLIQEPLRAYTAGALGNALSHKKMWERCAFGAAPVTVAEDDAVFNRHFAEKAPAVLAMLPPAWDIVLWGWNFDSILHVEVIEGLKQSVMHFDASMLGVRTLEFQEKEYDVLPLRLIGAFGLVCYTVSPKGAQRLGDLCFPLRNEVVPVPGLGRNIINFGIDTMMNKYYRSLQSYASFPPLVWTENDKGTSDVQRA
jgi:GR25 family glycosyltransferase involved in LPS biosynthesis